MTHKGDDTTRPVILRARNGDVIRADETGLTLRLSDEVVADVRRRLGATGAPSYIDAACLGDVDAWDLRDIGDWLLFQARLPGTDGPRGYRRAHAGGAVIAETGGPVWGLFSLGGSRRALGTGGAVRFPYHVVTADDDIGASGHAGLSPAAPVSTVDHLPEATLDSAIADAYVTARHRAMRALPLIYTRGESDDAARLSDLATGPAYENLMAAIGNLSAVADTMGKPARILAIGIDYLREDVLTPLGEFEPAMRDLVARIDNALWARGFSAPVITTMFDGSVPDRIAAQWALALRPPSPSYVVTGPSYAFETDRHHRLTPAGLSGRACVEAAAIDAMHAGDGWQCPIPVLAETDKRRTRITVRFAGLLPVCVDAHDPFGAGADAGFDLMGDTGGAAITGIARDPNDPAALILTLSGALPRGDIALRYAYGRAGAVRDEWASDTYPGARRWALPAELGVHG